MVCSARYLWAKQQMYALYAAAWHTQVTSVLCWRAVNHSQSTLIEAHLAGLIRPLRPPTYSRPRVSVGQREVCNNFNSDRGCPRRDCKFLHSCLKCRAPHASVVCPSTSGFHARTTQSTARTATRPATTQ